LFGVFNPTDKLVSGDRRQALPETSNLLCCSQCIFQVGGELVYKTTKEVLPHMRTLADIRRLSNIRDLDGSRTHYLRALM
jgi:hypothetical protein